MAATKLLLCTSLATLLSLGFAQEIVDQTQLFAQEVQQTSGAAPTASDELIDALLTGARPRHPFAEIVEYAEERRDQIAAEIRDYTCLLVKRERLHGRLQSHEYIQLKVRHAAQPSAATTANTSDATETLGPSDVGFAVYMKFLGPASAKGREVLYVAGENDGQLLATKGGNGPLANVTLSLDPTSERAMAKSLHPITEIGILKLAERLVSEGRKQIEDDQRPEEWTVRNFEKAKIGDRLCKCIQLRRERRRGEDPLHTMRVFIDNELKTPVRYAMYHWPREEGAAEELVQEYTYTDLKINVGLKAVDFQRDNPAYAFYQRDDSKQASASIAE